MKYLKKFNESSHTVKQVYFNDLTDEEFEVIEVCKDILLDLKDDGFEISIIPFYIEGNSLCFNVSVSRDFEFTKEDANHGINHLISYFESIGYITNDDYEIRQVLNPNDFNICYLFKIIFFEKDTNLF